MASNDLNLLLAVTALQIEFVSRDQLIDAMQRWVQDKTSEITRIMRDLGYLDERQAELLENLAQEHMRRNGGTVAGGLAALSGYDQIVPDVAALEDATLNQTIHSVSQYRGSLDQTVNQGADSNTDADGTLLPPESAHNRLAGDGQEAEGRNRFRILRLHARGGLGQVSLADDASLHRNVALKEILNQYADSPSNRERFLVEAEITGRLQHPGIVPVYGLGTYPDGRPFYAMRFIEGDNLLTAIRHFHTHIADRPWIGEDMVTFRELLGRFLDVCDAMQFAHQRHVLHRDLKPHNIMLGEYGETLVVDWGLAKPLYEGQAADGIPESAIVPFSGSISGSEKDGSVIGTPDYMPPEQAAGKLSQLSERSDVYSLGATLYHLLTNSPPFRARSHSEAEAPRETAQRLLERVTIGDFPPPRTVEPRVPKALNAICMKAMALRPSRRYASPAELKQDLQRWLADAPVSVMPEAWYDRAARWFRQHRVASIISGIALLMISIITVISAVVVDRYRVGQLREATINQLATQLEALVDRTSAKNLPLDQTLFQDEIDPRLVSLVRLDSDRAARLERNALAVAADQIKAGLTQSTPSAEQLRELQTRLGKWSERLRRARDAESLSSVEEELQTLLDNRRAPWNMLPELSAAEVLQAAGNRELLNREPQTDIVRSAGGKGHAFVTINAPQLPTKLNHELIVRFHRDSLESPVVAIAISPQASNLENEQYQAVLCVDGYTPGTWSWVALRKIKQNGTLREKIDAGLPVRLLISRGRTLLAETTVNPGPGDFTLRLRREDERLRAMCEPQVGDSASVEYIDFLPYAHGQMPGIWFGPSTSVMNVTAGYRVRPVEQTETEIIKGLIGEADFQAALTMLNTRADGESLYLRSRCLRQTEERLQILDGLLSQTPSINQDGVVLEDWYLPALLDAMELNLVNNNSERFRELVRQLAFLYATSIEDVAIRIPADLRNRLVSEFRKQGARWRISMQSSGDTPMLDTAVQLDRVLEPDPVMKRATRWRRCDAWRAIDKIDLATEELRTLLRESLADSNALPGEAAHLFSDLCWTYFAKRKLNELELLLGEYSGRSDLPESLSVALDIERSRLDVHRQQPEQALARLTALLEAPERMRISQFMDACLVAGFIEQDRGNEAAAQAFWQQGLTYDGRTIGVRNPDVNRLHGMPLVEHQWIISIYGILASLTESFTNETVQEQFDAHIPKGGIFGAAAREIVESKIPPEQMNEIATAIYLTPQGNEVARNMAYRLYSINDFGEEPVKLILFEGVVLKSFADYRGDAELMNEIFQNCTDLFGHYEARRISEQQDMRQILAIWEGEANDAAVDELSDRLGGTLAPGLRLLAGRGLLLKSQSPEVAEPLKQTLLARSAKLLAAAKDHPAAEPAVARYAQRFLDDVNRLRAEQP